MQSINIIFLHFSEFVCSVLMLPLTSTSIWCPGSEERPMELET